MGSTKKQKKQKKPSLVPQSQREKDLFMIYVQEVGRHASYIQKLCDEVFARSVASAQRDANGNPLDWVSPGHETHRAIAQVLSSSAMIAKYLRKPRKTKRPRPAGAKNLHTTRSRWLRHLLAPAKLAAIASTDFRNAIEHYDEQLDDAVATGWDANEAIAVSRAWAVSRKARYDMAADAFAAKGWPAPHTATLYVDDEQTYFHFGLKVHLGTMRDEATRILDRVVTVDPGFPVGAFFNTINPN